MAGVAEESLAEGQRYRVVSCLGVGQRSDSFLVQDQFFAGREAVRRTFHEDFITENKDLVDLVMTPWANLSHPNLPLIYDLGIEEGRAYFVREKAAGVKLTEALAGATRPQALALIGQLLLALDHLYANNILHLNLKPENILVDKSVNPWRLRLLDFGLSPVLYPPSKVESNAVGTPPFTAPEYAIRRTLDVRSDLYSVGIYLYLALAGRMPFAGNDTVGLLQAQLKSDPQALSAVAPSVSAKLSSVVQRLLSRDPQSRYMTPRLAWAALLEAADDPQLGHRVFLPKVFSDPEDVFRYQEYLKLFRRIALQGGRWVITGESGSGKSFLAGWLERLFWLNQKPVLRIPGREIALLEGEHSLNPAEPTYVLVDDADQGPVEAWLRARPYAHIVAFAKEKTWPQKKSGWQMYPLKPLDAKQIAGLLERDISLTGDRISAEWLERTKGEAGYVVQLGRALEREETIRPHGIHYKMEADKFFATSRDLAFDPGSLLEEKPKKLLTYLSYVQIPVRTELVASWAQVPPEEASELLLDLVRLGWVQRRVALGQEFFASAIEFSPAAKKRLGENEAKNLAGELERLEFHAAGLRALESYFGPKANPATALLRARLAAGARQPELVLKLVDSNFVNGLPPPLKAEAFLSLGRALHQSGKSKQADASLKNAYKGFQAAADPDGMARSLVELGLMTLEAGDRERAFRFYQQAMTEAEQSKDRDAIEGSVELHVGRLYALATDFENAETHFTSALQKLGYASQEASIAEVYANYAAMTYQMGDEFRAEALALEGLRRAIFIGNTRAQGEIFALLAKLQEQRGNLRGAAERYAEAIDRFAGSGLAYLRSLLDRAYFYERNRELILASQDAMEALKEAKRLQRGDLEGKAQLVLGKVMRRDINKLEPALAQLDLAYQKLAEAKDARLASEALFEKGEIERYRENAPQAKTHYQQAMQLLEHAMTQLVPGTADYNELQQKRSQIQMILETLG